MYVYDFYKVKEYTLYTLNSKQLVVQSSSSSLVSNARMRMKLGSICEVSIIGNILISVRRSNCGTEALLSPTASL